MSKANSKRKYFTEFNLNIFSSDPTILAPSDLDKISEADDEARERVKNSNIYLILKRPRITFLPKTVCIKNKEVLGSLSVQMEEGVFETIFKIKGKLPEIVRGVKVSKFPHTKLTLIDEKREEVYTYPITYLLRNMEVDLEGQDYMEVAYVGQAFGSAGERSAVERLASHSTLQKILADITANQPNMEVFLALYQFEYHRFLISMDGISQSEIQGDEDKAHYHKMMEANFKRSMRISLAEAALIRYFQPKYNKIYKNDFPKKRHKILKKLYDLDFAALTVEISIEDHGMEIYSENAKHSWHHIANFDLNDISKRKSFFFSKP